MGDLPWAIEIIRGLGTASGPVFAVLWWLERKERIDCQKTTKDLLVQTLTTVSNAANSVEAMTKMITELRAFTKESDDRLAQLIRSIKRGT